MGQHFQKHQITSQPLPDARQDETAAKISIIEVKTQNLNQSDNFLGMIYRKNPMF